jgi:superfamily II DNA/RNA helicase
LLVRTVREDTLFALANQPKKSNGMPCRVTSNDPMSGLDNVYEMSSVLEVVECAIAARRRNEQVLVFTSTVRCAKATAVVLETTGLRVASLTSDLARDERERVIGLTADDVDVLVANDAFAHGWRAPASLTEVRHVELPPYGAQFDTTMRSRAYHIGALPAVRRVQRPRNGFRTAIPRHFVCAVLPVRPKEPS